MNDYVYHEAGETAHVQIDTASFAIPSHEIFPVPDVVGTDANNNGPVAYRIPSDQVARKICEHGWYYGIVPVTVKVSKTGDSLTSDLEEAKVKAREMIRAAEDKMVMRYVNDQRERLTSTPGVQANPPSGRLIQIIAKRGFDLKRDFNLDPPGWTVAKNSTRDEELAELREQVKTLMEQAKGKKKEPVHA